MEIKKHIMNLVCACFILFSSLIITGQNNNDKNMLSPSFLPQIAQYKGKFYIANQGNNSFFRKTMNVSNTNDGIDSIVILYEFIPNGNTIKKLSESEFSRSFFSTCVVGNKIYIAGGFNNKGIATKNLYEYDLIQKKWIEKSDMFFPRAKFALECVNGRLYAIGGAGIKPSIEYYQPETDLWEIMDFKQIPSNFKLLDTISASAVIEDKIYLLSNNGATFQIFTTSKALLSEGPATPINSSYFDMLVMNKKLYVAAGASQSKIDNSIFLYDTVEGLWSEAGHIPLPRFGSGLAFLDKTIVFIGGSLINQTSEITPMKDIYLYRPMK
jgi:hypothetical protein